MRSVSYDAVESSLIRSSRFFTAKDAEDAEEYRATTFALAVLCVPRVLCG